MSYGKNLRIPLLVITLSSALLVLAKVSLYSAASRYPISSFTFFRAVPLSGWQLLSSTPLANALSSL